VTAAATTFLASIPSPAHSTLKLGPLTIHYYGLMLLIAIAACIALAGFRYVRRGGNWDLIFQIAVYGVVAGIVGARLYHDATSWNQVEAIGHWWGAFAFWKGGLGIYGGVLFGALAGAWITHRAGESVYRMLDIVAPALLLAQAVGRWGNWFNQELFGKPTSLPWGLKIDYAHCPDAYRDVISGTCTATFHPTFLYESLWSLAGVGLLLLLESRFRFHAPALFALYVAYYSVGRLWVEMLRIDPAHHFLGQRLNVWVSAVIFVAASGFFVWWQFLRKTGEPRPPRAAKVDPKLRMAVPRGRVRPGR
jgi:prolipoprotein diacylglyceryl transferase